MWGCSSFLWPFSRFAFINSVMSEEMLSWWEFVVTHSNMNTLTSVFLSVFCWLTTHLDHLDHIFLFFLFSCEGKEGSGELKRKVFK